MPLEGNEGDAATDDRPVGKTQRGIQSIEVGGQLLLALGRNRVPMVLRDLARAAGMSAAKAHPYLVSFSKLGLVEQDPATGRYELGPLALQLGLVSLQRFNPIRVATPEISALSERIGHSVVLAVWGTHGPTVVRFEEPTYPLHVNLRPGSVMSLVNTATGLVFAAFMPPKVVEAMIKAEPGRLGAETGAAALSRDALEQRLAEVRRHGLARAVGNPLPGVNAVSAPVFDYANTIVLAVTAMGPAGTLDPAWDGAVAREVAGCAAAISRRLGHE